MRIHRIVVTVLVLAASMVRPALAADQPLACKILSVKADKLYPTSGIVKFLCKAPKGDPLALPPPNSTSDPRNDHGGSLLIRDLGSSLYIFPGNTLFVGYWTGLGSPSGSKGYRYKNGRSDAPCRVVTVTSTKISGTCRAFMGLSTLPVVGEVGLSLTFIGNPPDQQVYCGQFGGTEVRNEVAGLLRKDAPAPVSCPPLI